MSDDIKISVWRDGDRIVLGASGLPQGLLNPGTDGAIVFRLELSPPEAELLSEELRAALRPAH